jgi:predicted  nucleic acid-binding Zn-ribbon protein
MEHIKTQISDLIKYKSTNLEDLKKEYQELRRRVDEGATKMKEASVFTESEIKEVHDYARQLVAFRFEDARRATVKLIRDSFEF